MVSTECPGLNFTNSLYFNNGLFVVSLASFFWSKKKMTFKLGFLSGWFWECRNCCKKIISFLKVTDSIILYYYTMERKVWLHTLIDWFNLREFLDFFASLLIWSTKSSCYWIILLCEFLEFFDSLWI